MIKYRVVMHKRDNKKLKIILISIAAVACVVIGVVAFNMFAVSKTLPEGQTAEVTIEEGSSTWTIAGVMSAHGVVEKPTVFTATVAEMGAEASLKPGFYIFEGGKSVREYVQILCDGPDSTSPKLVVHEGMKRANIALALEDLTDSRITADEFLNATNNASVYAGDYNYLESAGTNSLEGFLFPKTYAVTKKDSVDDIVRKMLDAFRDEISDLDFGYAYQKGLTLYDAVNLASIVEKESAPDMHYKVANVFYNRLKIWMPLNSDATTAYEVGHDPTPAEVHANTPYSTYTNYGLPPTPICSPGIEALKSVCWPEESNALFFVFGRDSNGDLVYRFSDTYEQHQQAITELGL